MVFGKYGKTLLNSVFRRLTIAMPAVGDTSQIRPTLVCRIFDVRAVFDSADYCALRKLFVMERLTIFAAPLIIVM